MSADMSESSLASALYSSFSVHPDVDGFSDNVNKHILSLHQF